MVVVPLHIFLGMTMKPDGVRSTLVAAVHAPPWRFPWRPNSQMVGLANN